MTTILKRLFSMSPKPRIPIVLVDFDETITNTETTPVLGQAGLDFHKNTLPWRYFIDTYMDDYNRIKSGLPPNLTPEEQIHALRPSEEASLARIHKRQVFEGMTRSQIFEQGQKLASRYVRPGVLEALSSLPKDRLRIVSVNWSKDWICGMLEPLALSYQQIHCNDLLYDAAGKATGEIERRVLTSYDKKKEMHLIKQEFPGDTPTVYIGDSPGDILPLVEADIGIIIGMNTRLLQSLETDFHISVIENEKPARPGIYRVDDWEQISASNILSCFPSL